MLKSYVLISLSFTPNNLYSSLLFSQYLVFDLVCSDSVHYFSNLQSRLLPFHVPLSISKNKFAPLPLHPFIIYHCIRTLTACVTLRVFLSPSFLCLSFAYLLSASPFLMLDKAGRGINLWFVCMRDRKKERDKRQ